MDMDRIYEFMKTWGTDNRKAVLLSCFANDFPEPKPWKGKGKMKKFLLNIPGLEEVIINGDACIQFAASRPVVAKTCKARSDANDGGEPSANLDDADGHGRVKRCSYEKCRKELSIECNTCEAKWYAKAFGWKVTKKKKNGIASPAAPLGLASLKKRFKQLVAWFAMRAKKDP